jgi:glucose-1-phosphate cytidylyltransferase
VTARPDRGAGRPGSSPATASLDDNEAMSAAEAKATGRAGPGRPIKAVILAGGLGSRISEETSLKPKPMIEIGGRPILWHILKIYSAAGVNDFVICCGYKGYVIKEYFANYFLHMSDVTFDMASNSMQVHQKNAEPWRVTLVDTGEDSMTGGRLRRVKHYVEDDECFCFTYGDGVADIDIAAEIAFHRSHGKQATVTAVQPPGRYGALRLDGARVAGFIEKPLGDGGPINGGFFVLSPRVIDRIAGDATSWELEPLAGLARDGELMAYAHSGFWQPMDTLREKNALEELWQSGRAPWKRW